MKPIDELRKLVCTVPEINEDITELRKWCLVNDTDFDTWIHEIFWELDRNYIILMYNDLSKPYLERKTDIEDWEIIWNPIQERHLRMYCSSEWWNCDIQSNNLVHIWRSTLWEDDKVIEEWKLLYYNSSLSLFQQSKKTIADILTFLKG